MLRDYPEAGGAERVVSYSPRPFSAASVVETRLGGRVFVKRHHRSVRDREGLLEEHRFLRYLADGLSGLPGLVQAPLLRADGDSATGTGEWRYEVHPLARGVDVYEQALSWTPFGCVGHAGSAGRALARLHMAARGYESPERGLQQLVSSYTIFAPAAPWNGPVQGMEAYLEARPLLRAYAEKWKWRRSFDELLMPLYASLTPWLSYLMPLWTHNDFHASNLMWTGSQEDAEVSSIVDFGLADRTNAVHDVAIAIERNIVEWLRMDEDGAALVHFDHLDALLAGYEELLPLSYGQARAVVAMLPLVHCEFALSETDYFLSVLNSAEKARLAYEGYFLAHADWFGGAQGRALMAHLERWAEERPRSAGGGC